MSLIYSYWKSGCNCQAIYKGFQGEKWDIVALKEDVIVEGCYCITSAGRTCTGE